MVGLPIGFEERNRTCGNQEVLKYFYNTKHEDKLNRVLLPYHTESNNPKRTEYINCLKGLSFVDVQEEKLPIMKTSTIDMIYHHDDLPCVLVDDWYNITNEFFSSFSEDEYNFNNVHEFMLTETHAEKILKSSIPRK